MDINFNIIGEFKAVVACDHINISSFRELYFKDCNGNEKWRKYDCYGNLIYFKDSNGIEWTARYCNDLLIYVSTSTGYEKFIEYDIYGTMVHEKEIY